MERQWHITEFAQDVGAIWIRENIVTVKMNSSAGMNSTREKTKVEGKTGQMVFAFCMGGVGDEQKAMC